MAMEDLANPNPDVVVAEWITRSLNQHGWTESVYLVDTVEEARATNYATVTRTYLPDWKLEDFEETRISVVPVESMPDRLARCAVADEVRTDVIICKRVRPKNINPVADTVLKLSQQIEYWFECNPMVTVFCEPCELTCRWLGCGRPRIYSLELIDQAHLVATTLAFRTLCVKRMCCCAE